MATTREKAEAYAYENRRQVTSLIRGTDEALGDPRQRLTRSLAGGIALGVLILAVFGVVGLLLKGGRGPTLPHSGAVMVADSGNTYVVLGEVVHEALNLSSALLAGGGHLTMVRADALVGTPRGLPVGIPEAPNALPPAGSLIVEPWTICAVPAGLTGGPARVRLYVGLPPAPDSELGETEGVLLRSPDGQVWLVAGGRRYALRGQTQTQLGLLQTVPISLPSEIIETIPGAPEIIAPAITGRGVPAEVPMPGGAVIGDVVVTGAGGIDPQYYVVQRDGLHTITQLTYRLLDSTGATTRKVGPGELPSIAPGTSGPVGHEAWPKAVPRMRPPRYDHPLCVSTRPGEIPGDAPWRVTLHAPDALPEPAGIRLSGLLEAVLVPSGRGAVVRSTTSAGQDGAYTLITDSGQRYPIVSKEAVSLLGYDWTMAPNVPSPFVDLLPRGPDLNPDAAAVKHVGTG